MLLYFFSLKEGSQFYNIIETCRKYSIKHLIYASSSSVYGNNHEIPFSEDYKTDTPISLYAATKKSDELIAHLENFNKTIELLILSDILILEFIRGFLCVSAGLNNPKQIIPIPNKIIFKPN